MILFRLKLAVAVIGTVSLPDYNDIRKQDRQNSENKLE